MGWSAVLAGTSMSMSYESACVGLSPDTLQMTTCHSAVLARLFQDVGCIEASRMYGVCVYHMKYEKFIHYGLETDCMLSSRHSIVW